MKRKLVLFFVYILAFCGAFFGINFSVNAQASITSPEITESTRANYDMDESLFKALLAIAKQLSYNKNVYGFDEDLFTYGYKNYTPNQNWDMNEEPYKTFQQNRDAIVNDLVKGELGRLMHLRNSTANIYEIESAEDKLKENINELGFICYNLYCDGPIAKW